MAVLCSPPALLSHPISKKAARLFLNVIGSDICTVLVGRLVLYLCAPFPTQPSGEQRSAAAALGMASLVFWGGGRCAVGCLVLVLGRRDMQSRPAYSWVLCFGSL